MANLRDQRCKCINRWIVEPQMCSWGLQSITKSGIGYRPVRVISTGQAFPSPLWHQSTADRGYLRPWASRSSPDEAFKLCFIFCMSFAVPRGAASDIWNALSYSMNTCSFGHTRCSSPALPVLGRVTRSSLWLKSTSVLPTATPGGVL